LAIMQSPQLDQAEILSSLLSREKMGDIFFAILVPEHEAETHLKALAGIARKLNDKEIVKAIRKANTKKEIVLALS